jgi:hypothetical protein
VGGWEAVVSDEEGKEQPRIRVGERDECLNWLDFDGRWLIISRMPGVGRPGCVPGSSPSPVVVIDTNAAKPTLQELRGVFGAATIVD